MVDNKEEENQQEEIKETDSENIKKEEKINDSQEREDKFTGDARVGMLFAGKEEDDESVGEAQSAVVLVHNLSKDYVLHSLRTSPLVQQYKLNTESSSDTPKKKVELISLSHNVDISTSFA